MSDSIDYLGALAYQRNPTDPVSVAVGRLAIFVTARDRIADARKANPQAFPLGTWNDLGAEALAAKLLGQLLDLGWEPPSADHVQTAVARLATDFYDTNGAGR